MRVQQSDRGLGHLSTLIVDEDAGRRRGRRSASRRRHLPRRRRGATACASRTSSRRTSTTTTSPAGASSPPLTGATHVIGAGAELALRAPPGCRDGERSTSAACASPSSTRPATRRSTSSYTRRRHEPRRGAGRCCSPAARSWSGRSGGRTCSAPSTPVPYARAMYHSLHDVILPHEDRVARLPDPRCRLAVLDRDRLDRRDRRSATSGATTRCSRRWRSTRSPGRCSPASRPSRATSPGCARSTRPGPPLLGGVVPAPRPLDPASASTRLVGRRRRWSSTRAPAAAHAAGHIPGSLSIPLGTSFGTWLGWVVDLDRPLVLVLERARRTSTDSIRQALRIGHEIDRRRPRRRDRRLGRRPGARSSRAAG